MTRRGETQRLVYLLQQVSNSVGSDFQVEATGVSSRMCEEEELREFMAGLCTSYRKQDSGGLDCP